MAGYPHGETVTRLRPAQVADPYSARTADDWANPAELDFDGVAVEPVPVRTEAATRPSEARSLVPVACRLYIGDATADVRPGDRWRVRGRVFRTAGEPAVWTSPLTGWRPGTVVELSTVQDE